MSISRRKLLMGAGAALAVAGAAGVVTPMIRREGSLVPGRPRYGFVEGSKEALPKQADVVVIGAGINGIMTAISLVERGLSVVVVEKGDIAGEQSSRAYGQVITYRMEGATFLMHQLGKKMWREMNAKVGADTSYRTQGRVEVPQNEEEMEHVARWIKEKSEAQPFGIALNTRFIDGSELKSRLPDSTTAWKVAAFEEDSGSLDSEITSFVMAEYAKKTGVKFFTQCAARGIETEAGSLSDVVTENGVIRTSRVVLAGGAWSRLFLENLGVSIPTLPAYQSQQIISGPAGAPKGNVALPGNIFFREQADGTYATSPRIITAPVVKESFQYGYKYLGLLSEPDFPVHIALNEQLIQSLTQPTHWALGEASPFERYRDMVAVPDLGDLDDSLVKLRAEFPAFKDARVIDRWSGAMAIAPDEAPIISVVDGYPGLVVNTATGWGMTESPVSSELTASLLLGETPLMDTRAFSLQRF
ncbi:NAD(P)/FAD-dependent oxidoreductase [Pseudomonas sp. RIT-To-2]|uniref:NAD(P)/FAD-dependent oxidoreductase n=1 Tax=Pseudomonas sp. RIT-To-2 TaxID=3462541 RepID=UPI0040485BC1